jgi:hypothetical protein
VGTRIELPSGGWVELRDLSDVRGGDRKKIMTDPRISTARKTENEVVAGYALTETLVEFFIERYQLDYRPFASAIRVQMVSEDWDNLKIPDQNAVIAELEPVRAALFPEAPSPDNMAPGSPTPPVGD